MGEEMWHKAQLGVFHFIINLSCILSLLLPRIDYNITSWFTDDEKRVIYYAYLVLHSF